MKHVYAMSRPDGAIKVGISGDPEVRKGLLSYQIKQPVKLMFSAPKRSDARTVEKIAHKLLETKRDKGEWFFISLQEAMNAISVAVDIAEGRTEDTTGVLAKLTKRQLEQTTDEEFMEARNYRFPKSQLAELKRISTKRGIKEPELMRRALEDFILKCKREEVSE